MSEPITLDEIDRGIILGALDSLATKMACAGLHFDEGERAIYEQAVHLLGGAAPDLRDIPEDDADKWKHGG